MEANGCNKTSDSVAAERILSTIPQVPPRRFDFASSHDKSKPRSEHIIWQGLGQGTSSQCDDKRLISEECHPAYLERNKGIFQSCIPGPQAHRGLSVGNRPVSFEPIHVRTTIQDGHYSGHKVISGSEHVGHLNRHVRCLLPRTNPPLTTPVSGLYSGESALPVQGSSFRPLLSSMGVYHDYDGGQEVGKKQRYYVIPVPGRLANSPPRQSHSGTSNIHGGREVYRVGTEGESSQIRNRTIPTDRIPRRTVRFCARQSFPDPTEVRQNPYSNQVSVRSQRATPPNMRVSPRPLSSHRKDSSTRETQLSSLPSCSEKRSPKRQRHAPHSECSGPCPSGSALVVDDPQHICRSTIPTSGANMPCPDGCIQGRLGSCVQGPIMGRQMDIPPTEEAYQLTSNCGR